MSKRNTKEQASTLKTNLGQARREPVRQSVKQLHPKDEIVRLHNEVMMQTRDVIRKGIRVGELLFTIKDDLEHGMFTQYAQENFPFTLRMAQNYMKLFKNRDHILANLQNLESVRDALQLDKEGKTNEPKHRKEDKKDIEKKLFLSDAKKVGSLSRLAGKRALEEEEIGLLRDKLKAMLAVVEEWMNQPNDEKQNRLDGSGEELSLLDSKEDKLPARNFNQLSVSAKTKKGSNSF